MSAQFPSSTNVFLPSHEATGNLMVGYSRNISKFALNQYMQIVPVNKAVGAYLVWTSREAARILTSDDRAHFWPDGQDAPHGRDELESFRYETYRTERYVYPFAIGQRTVKQADWPIINAHSKAKAQQAMTARTVIAKGVLDSYSWGTHELGVNGGLFGSGVGWDTGTSTNPVVLDTLNQAAQLIHLDTIGAVEPTDLIVVMGPEAARKLAKSPEIHAYLQESPFAKARLGIGGNNDLMSNSRFGLPPDLYGYKLVIEDTPRLASPKGAATQNPAYAWGDDDVYILARPGGLEGLEGSPSFSTIQGFFLEEFTVETKEDPDNRRTQGRIVSDFDIKVTGEFSGVRLVHVFSDDSSGS